MADLQLGVSALAQNPRDFWPAFYAAKSPAFSISQLIMTEQIKQLQKERLSNQLNEKCSDAYCFLPGGVKRDEPFDMTTKNQGQQSVGIDNRDENDSKVFSGKLVPVHCVVEIETRTSNSGSSAPTMEADSYVMVPSHTAFSEIIPVAMEKLGYQEEVSEATAKLVVKNWKPLHLDQIASPTDSVGRILGEMTNTATLKINIRRNCEKIAKDLREKLLRVLLPQSKKILSNLGCPLDEAWLQQLASEKTADAPPDELCRRFEDWFRNQNNNSHQVSTSITQEIERSHTANLVTPMMNLETSQIQEYVQELNALESRRGRKPLDVANIVYWFKNARAAQKRTESRQNGESKSPNYIGNELSDNEDDELLNDPSAEEEGAKEAPVAVKEEGDVERVSNTSNHSDSDESVSEYEEFENNQEKSFKADEEIPENLSCKDERTYPSESGSSWPDQKFSQEQHQQLLERYANFPVPMGHTPF